MTPQKLAIEVLTLQRLEIPVPDGNPSTQELQALVTKQLKTLKIEPLAVRLCKEGKLLTEDPLFEHIQTKKPVEDSQLTKDRTRKAKDALRGFQWIIFGEFLRDQNWNHSGNQHECTVWLETPQGKTIRGIFSIKFNPETTEIDGEPSVTLTQS